MMNSNNDYQVVDSNSCLSVLQQRVKYARHLLNKKDTTYFVENVPVWPDGAFLRPEAPHQETLEYADCNGSNILLKAVCERDVFHYGSELRPENILITNGGMHALSLVFRRLYRKGAEAICMAPVFTSVPALLHTNGYSISYYTVNDTSLQINDILALCKPETRLLYLNFPHNPLGGIYTDTFMHSLLEELSKRKISLVLDLVYDSFIFNDERIISPFVCTASWSDIYTINSISKNYGAPGLRIGWITSAAKNILQLSGDLEKECVSVCTPAQTKAAQLIQAGNTPLLDSVIKTRKIVRSKLVEGGLIKAFPTAGTQVFVDLQFENVEDYADFALVQYGLVLATSSNYTGTKNSYVRIPTSYPSCITELAMNKLLKSLKEYECNCNYVKSY